MFKKILNWITSWFTGNQEYKYDLYLPQERCIYSYFNGVEIVKADPLVLYSRMMDRWKELDIDIKMARFPLEEFRDKAKEGEQNMLKKIRHIFSIKEPVDELRAVEEGTLQKAELTALLDHFMVYTNWLKKNSSPSQTPPVESKVSESSSVENQPTQNISDTGSTENAVCTEQPTQSPSESGLPLVCSILGLTTTEPSQTATEKPNS